IHSPMLFASGSEQINNRYDDLLQHFVTQLQALPLRVTVEGHTDARPLRGGPSQTNLALSAARAAAVGERLLTLGLPPEQLSVAGYGAERPVASNATEEGRARNRRIVLRVIPEAYVEPAGEPFPASEPVGS
ncbi:MAG: OmpA/MotB family protein, partial [Pseudomonadales bacterium]